MHPDPHAGLQTQADVDALCRAARLAWYHASGSQRLVRFRWRGRWYRSTLTSFRMLITTAAGTPVAARYHPG